MAVWGKIRCEETPNKGPSPRGGGNAMCPDETTQVVDIDGGGTQADAEELLMGLRLEKGTRGYGETGKRGGGRCGGGGGVREEGVGTGEGMAYLGGDDVGG